MKNDMEIEIIVKDILDVEKYFSNIDAVIFDLDDTLYSEKQYIRSGYKKIAEYFNIPDMEKEMWNCFKSGGKAIDEVLKVHGLINKKEQALYIYRFQEPKISLYSGVEELLIRTKKKKKIGIITDGRPEGQRAKLKALNINVDKVIITDELGGTEYRKPNPKAFEIMQKELNTEFEKMVYIGDNIKKDFIAPQKLGMKYIWFKNPDGLYV